ncbi:FAD-dependent oxidoreductase [Natronocella acetinitrilica]|nr:FAD-dependent oxidoreductase [Natronocella acetinitrilica]
MKRDPEIDVLVVGSGAAGLTAAILAHDQGSRVLVLECSDKVGGTTAVSGGGIWIPNNHHMHEVGASDSRQEALAYCKAMTMGRADESLVETFIDTAPEMLRYLEEHTPLHFTPLTTPDYHPEERGGKLRGRSVEPAPFAAGRLGAWRDKLRQPSMMSFSMTLQEVFETYQAFYRPWDVPQDLMVERMEQDLVTLGQALAGSLLSAVLEREIPIRLDARAQELIIHDGRVAGVRLDKGEQVLAERAVVLASAGFEWDDDLKSKFITGTVPYPNSPPFNRGDGLKMAMALGADLANMGEVWNYPSIIIPGETYEGRPLSRGIKAERAGPHVIWVNARGQRFVNEAANYNSVGKAFFTMDTSGPNYRNLPAWAVLDQQFRSRYIVGTATPDDPDPDWLPRADSLRGLAEQLGIDPDGLEETVERWNTFVRAGRDRDFGRGDSAFDRYQGDHKAPHPTLGTIEEPPFYSLSLQPGALGTKGGPRTNASAQVLDVEGQPINGLYAAGNVAASITGPSYYGVGSTLGPVMTWGYIAGKAAAGPGD